MELIHVHLFVFGIRLFDFLMVFLSIAPFLCFVICQCFAYEYFKGSLYKDHSLKTPLTKNINT